SVLCVLCSPLCPCHSSSTKSTPSRPIALNLSYRLSRRVLPSSASNSVRTRSKAMSTERAAASGLLCAPPTGSAMISSTIPAPTAALTAHDDDDRHIERHHLAKVDGDRFGDAALLRFDPRKGRRRIDEHHDRPMEFLRHPHRPQRLAVPFGPRVSEVAKDLLL